MFKLTVLIVSYNVREWLRACLHSVNASAERSADWLKVDVLVVDNASRDGSADMVAAEFPQVRLLALEENLGFTGANNLGLETLGFTPSPGHPTRQAPDFVLLLNPDTEVVGDALGRMAGFLRDHPGAGVCGAQLRYGDGNFQHGAFRFPGLMQMALDLFPWAEVRGVRRFLPKVLGGPLNGRYPRRLWEEGEPFLVDFVLGAALMVRGQAIHQVGLLDPGYFMYCEEMDWCLRLAAAGWAVYAEPKAVVIHHEGQSSRQTPWPTFERLWRSRLRFFRKHEERQPPGFRWALGVFIRAAFLARSWLARRRFAKGRQDGVALGQELDAYASIAGALGQG